MAPACLHVCTPSNIWTCPWWVGEYCPAGSPVSWYVLHALEFVMGNTENHLAITHIDVPSYRSWTTCATWLGHHWTTNGSRMTTGESSNCPKALNFVSHRIGFPDIQLTNEWVSELIPDNSYFHFKLQLAALSDTIATSHLFKNLIQIKNGYNGIFISARLFPVLPRASLTPKLGWLPCCKWFGLSTWSSSFMGLCLFPQNENLFFFLYQNIAYV